MARKNIQVKREATATVGYLRVSTDGQEDGNGLDVQRQYIVAYAAVQGLTIDRWYSDVESGAKEDRPGLAAMRQDVAGGSVAQILVYRLDRLAREVLLAEQLYREFSAASKVVSVSESFGDGFTGDLMRRILAAFADYERAVIATRTKSGRREAVRKNGSYSGGAGVLGYRPSGTKEQPGQGRLVIVAEEAEAVRTIFALRSEGLTLEAIAQEVNRRGYRTPRGQAFGHVQVLRALKRERFYKGQDVITRTVDATSAAHVAILT